MKNFLAILLSLTLGLFLTDAAVSFLDDTLVLALDSHALSAIRGAVALLFVLAGLPVYLLMGLTPMIPKRYFLSVTVFTLFGLFAIIPVSIYYYDRIQQAAWLLSLLQVSLGLVILVSLSRGLNFRWPFVREEHLGTRMFCWSNLILFTAANFFVLLPGTFLYLAFCVSGAVDHFSGSFLALHQGGLSMQARKYVRDDGKTIHLIPMMHIGESSFYDAVTRSLPTNSVVLLEGVTDRKNLLERKINYRRMAKSLGLTEQQEAFEPEQVTAVHADVDVEIFSESTIEFLKLASLLHADGPTPEVFQKLIQKSQNPALTRELWRDILTKRNDYLLGEIKQSLLRADVLVVPWGAAHMPEVAKQLLDYGFRVAEVRNIQALRFTTVLTSLFSSPDAPADAAGATPAPPPVAP